MLKSFMTRLNFLLLCYIKSMSLRSHSCSAWRGLWSERDATAEVPAPGERDPGTRSRGGHHPGELTARHSDASKHKWPLDD